MGKSTLEPEAPPVTVHMIGNAHIDPIWLWRWEEGQEVILSTCRDAVANLRRFPGFIFCRSSAASYKVVEQRDPALFQQIRRFVKEGRWCIVNGWWEQPDCNIPCGESFVRHALYGKGYFREKFGVDVTVGYNVDTFGHCGTLPQILSKSGLRYYVFFRPGQHEMVLPGLFWWQSADGSRVLACRPPVGYASRPGDLTESILRAANLVEPGVSHVMCFYGRGDHGGGPTPDNIRSIMKMQKAKRGPAVQFSTPERFFSSVLAEKTDYPVVAEDLQHHARGCYTAVSEVKRRNRECELRLMTAEKFSTVARRHFRIPYPKAEFSQAWQGVLFNQFHDILAGTSIRSAYEHDVYPAYERARQTADAAIDRALSAIARRADTRGKGQPVIIFNPCAWSRRDVVRVRVPARVENLDFRVVGPGGRDVPCQVVAVHFDGGRHDAEIAFLAQVGGLGFRVYHLLNEKSKAKVPELKATESALENSHMRIAFDPHSGAILSLKDKVTGSELLERPGNRFIVLDDPSDTWSHGVDAFRKEIGAFHARGRISISSGPVCGVASITSEYGRSLIEQQVILYNGLRWVDFHTTIDWHEQLKMLKVAFPWALGQSTATFEIPYGAIVRKATGNEEPGQRWIDVTGKCGQARCGVSLLNDCKYGFDVKESEMRMSILRSPVYAFHDPRKIDPRLTYEFTDQGTQRLRYAVVPHAGTWQEAHIPRQGWEFNLPLIARLEPAHPGALGRAGAFLEAGPENVILTVAKEAEKGSELVLRCYEAEGSVARARIHMPHEGLRLTARLSPWEIKTLRISPSGAARECNLLEQPV